MRLSAASAGRFWGASAGGFRGILDRRPPAFLALFRSLNTSSDVPSQASDVRSSEGIPGESVADVDAASSNAGDSIDRAAGGPHGAAGGVIRADVHMPYFKKYLWIALGAVAYSAWCAYDLRYSYPTRLRIAEAYETIPKEERGERWTEVAEENGWATAKPKRSAAEMRSLIFQNYLMLFGSLAIGTISFFKWYLARETWIEGNESFIRNSRGKEFPLDAVTRIDTKKWEHKGIAVVSYRHDGRPGEFVLDDFKYDRVPTGQLLTLAQRKLEAKSGTSAETTVEPTTVADDPKTVAEGGTDSGDDSIPGPVLSGGEPS